MKKQRFVEFFFDTNFHELIKNFSTCTDENPFSFNKEQIPKEVAFGEGTFFSRFARNRTNLFKSFKSFSNFCLICTDLYDLTSSTVGSAR